MALLILGLILWSAAHWFKRFAPDRRAAMGDRGKGVVSLGIVAGIVAMIYGYMWAELIPVWQPPGFMVHINNLLMLIAFFLFGMSATTGRLRGAMRHPMLMSVMVWSVAHLLVNGDLASIVLFGGLGLWALASIVVINRAETVWQRPQPGAAKKDILLVVITLVAFSLTAALHAWLGVWPFPS